jgi:hypothetical protein
MSAPVLPKPANDELVAVAWAQSVAGIPAGKVARTLPKRESWAGTGFVQIEAIVGGAPHRDFPLYQPVVQFGCWAARPNSDTRPPWGEAFILAERLKRACEPDNQDRSKLLVLPNGFEQVIVQDASVIFGTRRDRLPSPESYAHVLIDIQILWTIHTPEV